MVAWWRMLSFIACVEPRRLTRTCDTAQRTTKCRVPDDSILYTRKLAHGPAVRVRRTSQVGVQPVIAVLEVDRRAGTPREFDGGYPPPLIIVEGATESVVLATLEPQARDDSVVAGLMRDKGLR